MNHGVGLSRSVSESFRNGNYWKFFNSVFKRAFWDEEGEKLVKIFTTFLWVGIVSNDEFLLLKQSFKKKKLLSILDSYTDKPDFLQSSSAIDSLVAIFTVEHTRWSIVSCINTDRIKILKDLGYSMEMDGVIIWGDLLIKGDASFCVSRNDIELIEYRNWIAYTDSLVIKVWEGRIVKIYKEGDDIVCELVTAYDTTIIEDVKTKGWISKDEEPLKIEEINNKRTHNFLRSVNFKNTKWLSQFLKLWNNDDILNMYVLDGLLMVEVWCAVKAKWFLYSIDSSKSKKTCWERTGRGMPYSEIKK